MIIMEWSWVNEDKKQRTTNWKLMQCYSPKNKRYFNSSLRFVGRGRVSMSLVLFSQFDNFSKHRFWRLISVAKDQQLINHGQYLYTCMTHVQYSTNFIAIVFNTLSVHKHWMNVKTIKFRFPFTHSLFLIPYYCSGKLSREKTFTNFAITATCESFLHEILGIPHPSSYAISLTFHESFHHEMPICESFSLKSFLLIVYSITLQAGGQGERPLLHLVMINCCV